MCSELDLSFPDTENAAGVPQSPPRSIERSPRNLIGEVHMSFDAGLLVLCLKVLVTILDVCANLIDPGNSDGQQNWSQSISGFLAVLWLTRSIDPTSRVGFA